MLNLRCQSRRGGRVATYVADHESLLKYTMYMYKGIFWHISEPYSNQGGWGGRGAQFVELKLRWRFYMHASTNYTLLV